jgi:hypothetical protein
MLCSLEAVWRSCNQGMEPAAARVLVEDDFLFGNHGLQMLLQATPPPKRPAQSAQGSASLPVTCYAWRQQTCQRAHIGRAFITTIYPSAKHNPS